MMTNKRFMRSTILIAVLAALGVSRVALAVDEVEPNDPVASAQKLTIGSDGTATVNASILNTAAHRDVDFYSFQATEGDIITANIDGGMSASMTGIWTVLAIFGPGSTGPLDLLSQVSGSTSTDAGSATTFDARVDNFVVPQTGTYVVGVSTEPGEFVDVNTLLTGVLVSYSPLADINAPYTLIISGVTPPAPQPPAPVPPPVVTPTVQEISIEIRPGRRDVLWAYSPSRNFDRDHDLKRDRQYEALVDHLKGGMPVALLSSGTFKAQDIDPHSLKFGATGTEDSFIRCSPHGIDVNHDKRRDLLCFFDFAKANFQAGDMEGKLTGTTKSGQGFEGHAWLKIMTGRRHLHDHDQKHDRHRR